MKIIQGEKFISLADNKKIFYCHTHDVNNFFKNDFNEDFILISHNSDAVVTDNIRNRNSVPANLHANIKNIHDKCVRWFAQNVEVEHDRLESIPIGFENSYCQPSVMKLNKIANIINKDKHIKNLIYLNLNINNNISERLPIYEMLKHKSYATTEYGRNGLAFDEYLDNLYNHKFMVCPEGNGIDVHQPWESIYVNTIPIQKKNINNKNWRELPICWLDDWSQLEDEDFLISEYDRITNTKFDKSKLYFDFWQNKIINSI
jgi:hypothetical protein